MENEKTYSTEWGGRTLTIGVGKLAQQANGSCTVQYGDTLVLCTATMGGVREGLDFFPLAVDFEERLYAAGRIKGSRFIKREGRPTDEAVLSGRLIDRAIRPLFDDRVRNEIAVVATVLSHDQENDADILGLVGAACALGMSDIPWNGPLGACRVGRNAAGEWILNPTYKEIADGGVDIVVAGRDGKTLMLEAGTDQLPDDQAADAIAWAHEQLAPMMALIEQVQAAHGKQKQDLTSPKTDDERAAAEKRAALLTRANEFLATRTGTLFANPLATKADRKSAVSALKAELDAHLKTQDVSKDDRKASLEAVDGFVDAETTKLILDGRRADGRAMDQIRALTSAVGILPRVHGSGLFERGSTQVLSAVTLGSPGMVQTIDTMEFQETRAYFHHYNFPSYSVGETKGNRGPGRREIGHGALAERAIQPVLPAKEQFPYTIRVVSEVLGSNGSSSMGATCGSTLALMDAGVPIKAPVAGIAMGVASDEATGRFRVFTDLQDLEDGDGGMDFKVAGTKDGVTAIQMDTKTSGIPLATIREAFAMAKTARLQILDVMAKAIAAPRAELSKWAPRIESFMINPEKIREVIGPGGKMINEIIAQTGVQIDIEDSGLVMITAVDPEGMKKAVDWVKQLTREVAVGELFTGPVTRIMDFGAFVEILPKQEGLVHISELAPERVGRVEDVVKVGDVVTVKVYEIDSQGRMNLSIKRANPDYVPSESDNKPLRDRKSGGSGSGGRGFGGGDRDRRSGGGSRRF
ncbi:MAG: Polyribonucleotide nucleotidyltransferase [Candidatus Parcubacteria bacterium]|jgi:polyribonucleotide nucleotidyltransferase